MFVFAHFFILYKAEYETRNTRTVDGKLSTSGDGGTGCSAQQRIHDLLINITGYMTCLPLTNPTTTKYVLHTNIVLLSLSIFIVLIFYFFTYLQ